MRTDNGPANKAREGASKGPRIRGLEHVSCATSPPRCCLPVPWPSRPSARSPDPPGHGTHSTVCPVVPTALTMTRRYLVCSFPWLFLICSLRGGNVPESQACSIPHGIERLGPVFVHHVPRPLPCLGQVTFGSSFPCSRAPRGSLWLVAAEPGPSSEVPRPRGSPHGLPASHMAVLPGAHFARSFFL